MSVAVTLNLDESVLEILKKEAERRGTSIDEAASAIIQASDPSPRPFGIEPFDLMPRPGVDYVKLNRLMAEEDFEIFVEKASRDTGVDLRG